MTNEQAELLLAKITEVRAIVDQLYEQDLGEFARFSLIEFDDYCFEHIANNFKQAQLEQMLTKQI